MCYHSGRNFSIWLATFVVVVGICLVFLECAIIQAEIFQFGLLRFFVFSDE
jgi:hypothetical protein